MYYIKSFDSLTLPDNKLLSHYDDRGRGNAQPVYLPMPNGWYRAQGDTRAKRGIQTITKQCLIYADTSAALLLLIEAIAAKIGIESTLIVEWWDGTQRQINATLTDFQIPSFVGDNTSIVATLVFSTGDQYWRKTSTYSSSQSTTARTGVTQDKTWDFTGQSGLTVRDPIIRVSPVGSSITLISMQVISGATPDYGTFYQVIWNDGSNPINPGDQLFIDCGAKRIYDQDGAPMDFSKFYTQNKHEWFALIPGNNTIRFSVLGNSSQNLNINITIRGAYG